MVCGHSKTGPLARAMIITASSALWFAPFLIPICIWVALSDLRAMRIPNVSVYAMVVIFAIVGLIALPFEDYLWRYSHLVVVLVIGMVMTAGGLMGAGDAKFAAAAAPFIAFGDLRLIFLLFAAMLLAGFSAHRLVKHSPLRKLAPDWKSWNVGWDYPMGLSLGATLALYLVLGAVYGQ